MGESVKNFESSSMEPQAKKKHLIFSLGGNRYGLALSEIKEVIGICNISAVPKTPSFYKGLINLRGKIISVIDMRLKLSFDEAISKETSIIISRVGNVEVGCIVDEVLEVVGYSEDQINMTEAERLNKIDDGVFAVANSGDSLTMLIDIEKSLRDANFDFSNFEEDSNREAKELEVKIAESNLLKKEKKHLIFSLGERRYGLPLARIKEVIGVCSITPLPNVPRFYEGLINLRGQIISVIDLRDKLSYSRKKSKQAAIIISHVGEIEVGSIVDEVVEVIGYKEQQIEKKEVGRLGRTGDGVYAVATDSDESLTLLIDIEKAMNGTKFKVYKENHSN